MAARYLQIAARYLQMAARYLQIAARYSCGTRMFIRILFNFSETP